ncbi:MAG: ABC transporter permease [Natronincolaceae bacterium]|jgi:ABC-2 type transport system permease protein|nr:ABC transporter permease [Bacillota bacterium]NLK90028.1 ABC transporter permease [Clostridiales bacterium]
MTVYRYFIKITTRYKWIILGYAAIFFLLSVISSINTKTKETAFMEESLNIGIVDDSKGSLSDGLIDYLGKNNTIVEMENDIDYIKDQIFLEVVDAVIIIPQDFQSRVENKEESVEIFRDDRKMESLQIENQVNKFLVFSNATRRDGKFDLARVKDVLKEKVNVDVLKTGPTSKNSGTDAWFGIYFNFIGYIVITIYILVIGLIMAEFNDKNIRDRMRISSKKFLKSNAEIYLGQITLGMLITTIFILGGIILKGKHIGEVDLSRYLINAYVFSFAILCFTFLINNLTTSRFAISGVSTVVSLGTAFVSGVFVPQELLGEKVLAMAKFFPMYYYVRINNMKAVSAMDMSYGLRMQLLFGAIFLLTGLGFSRAKQKI